MGFTISIYPCVQVKGLAKHYVQAMCAQMLFLHFCTCLDLLLHQRPDLRTPDYLGLKQNINASTNAIDQIIDVVYEKLCCATNQMIT